MAIKAREAAEIIAQVANINLVGDAARRRWRTCSRNICQMLAAPQEIDHDLAQRLTHGTKSVPFRGMAWAIWSANISLATIFKAGLRLGGQKATDFAVLG